MKHLRECHGHHDVKLIDTKSNFELLLSKETQAYEVKMDLMNKKHEDAFLSLWQKTESF